MARKCVVPNSGATFKGRFDGRMRFELLEGLEGVEVRIGVVQTHNESHGAKVVLGQVVQEGAAVSFRVLEKDGGKGFIQSVFFLEDPIIRVIPRTMIGQPTVCSILPGLCFSGSICHNSLIPIPYT